MFSLILFAALTGQMKLSPEQADLYFAAIQEQFVYEASPDKSIPKYIDKLFVELGCTEWATRDAASKKLYQLCKENPNESRWVFWGRQNRDFEVAYRCDKIISRLNTCTSCGGSGTAKTNQNYDCWQCKNLGTIWGLHPWDNRQ